MINISRGKHYLCIEKNKRNSNTLLKDRNVSSVNNEKILESKNA